ncbi:sugar ABC transporter substrate-binding protein [Subtercola boreus]|uniref:Sugar ABC transporter substrate-binding protein n=2 Tax=Subtercola boreus TaxID=120213 RepID=A0A3E0W7T1_9MICO|nr:sugar ABC transporter substrate-binding protein [Subtercola boreus]RFA24577.1 sugar ABC transporter substrate-binding protein [Subtercola boreus]
MLRNNTGPWRFSRRARVTSAVALGAVALLALSACGAGGSTASTSSGAKSLTVLVEAGGHGELQPIADAYEKQTGTKITFVELPYDGLYNRLNSEFSSGTVSFDVAALDAIWLPAFKDAVTPLNDMFTDDVKADLFPSLVAGAQIDGTYVGMPAWANSEILYYRTDLFNDPTQQANFKAKYGYDLVPPTTWQQYSDVAAFFTQPDAGLYGTSVKGAVETEWLANLSQAGEKNMVIDSSGKSTLGDKASLDALNFYTSQVPNAPAGAAQVDWAAAQNLFNQGKTAVMLFWAHAYSQIPTDAPVAGKVGVAPMIGGSAGVAGVPGPWYLSVAKASPNQQAGLDFLKFAYDNNALSVTSSLGLAARISAFEKYQNEPKYAAFKPLIATLNAPSTISRPADPKWQQIVDTVLVPMIQKAVVPGADNQQLLEEAKTQVDAITNK